jgi:hypothetical protein
MDISNSINKEKNSITLNITKLLKDKFLLPEQHIDYINNFIFETIKDLSPKRDILIIIQDEIPINIWVYIFSLINYIDKNLIIYTIEDINIIQNTFPLMDSIILKDIKELD